MTAPRQRRAVHGIVLLDKPVGMTSNYALQRVKQLFRAAKAGHTGNLDSPASGLLPVCLGEATKVTSFLLDADKEYITRIKFGISTNTGDAAGNPVAMRPVPRLSADSVDAVLVRFTGRIEQVPPMYSALKHEGERLYRLAAQGITVEREARDVTIHRLERLSLAGDELEILVRCSKGTYIRTLAEDIGTALATCAHVLTLRRTEVEPFRIEQAHTLAQLEALAARGLSELDAQLIPVDTALPNLPAVRFPQASAYYVRTGQAVRAGRPPSRGLVRMYDEQDRFMGIGETLDDGRIAPRRLLNLN